MQLCRSCDTVPELQSGKDPEGPATEEASRIFGRIETGCLLSERLGITGNCGHARVGTAKLGSLRLVLRLEPA